MSSLIRAFSIVFTSLPALVWLSLIILARDNDYFWIVNIVAGIFFLIISLMLGGVVPVLFPKIWLRRPGLWITGQGLFAWLSALLILGILNLTPLCVGQDNEDGFNDFGLCILQTMLVGFFYSFPELLLLGVSAIPGGFLIKKITLN